MKVLIALNSTWNLANFRAGLIRGLIAAGHEVVAVAPPDKHTPRVEALGCRYLRLPMDNKGTHPLRDLLLFWRFLQVLRAVRPDVYLGYTVKPNIYGSLAARQLGIPVINNIAGLGAVFIKGNWLTRLMRLLYRLALGQSRRVFFQNEDDRQLFIESGLVNPAVTDRLPGSGIDLATFSKVAFPAQLPFRFVLIARMLWDKGVGEYVEAARQLKRFGVNADFCLLGFLDVANPAAISRQQMEAWVADGFVQYLGEADDVRGTIASAHCVVLPSYREGTPRTLLEAAAMGRPIITTDAVGCREVVDDGVNGYQCKVRDATDLAGKMVQMMALPAAELAAMGQRGREKVERQFDEKIVIAKYLAVIEEINRDRK